MNGALLGMLKFWPPLRRVVFAVGPDAGTVQRLRLIRGAGAMCFSPCHLPLLHCREAIGHLPAEFLNFASVGQQRGLLAWITGLPNSLHMLGQQRVVALAPEPHQLAGDEHRHELPFDRPLEGDVLHPLQPEIERRLPRPPEFLGAGRSPQHIGVLEDILVIRAARSTQPVSASASMNIICRAGVQPSWR